MENIWGLFFLLTKTSFDVWRLYLSKKKKGKEQHGMQAIFSWEERKNRRVEWYGSKPRFFILHNQLSIIIRPLYKWRDQRPAGNDQSDGIFFERQNAWPSWCRARISIKPRDVAFVGHYFLFKLPSDVITVFACHLHLVNTDPCKQTLLTVFGDIATHSGSNFPNGDIFRCWWVVFLL